MVTVGSVVGPLMPTMATPIELLVIVLPVIIACVEGSSQTAIPLDTELSTDATPRQSEIVLLLIVTLSPYSDRIK